MISEKSERRKKTFKLSEDLGIREKNCKKIFSGKEDREKNNKEVEKKYHLSMDTLTKGIEERFNAAVNVIRGLPKNGKFLILFLFFFDPFGFFIFFYCGEPISILKLLILNNN